MLVLDVTQKPREKDLKGLYPNLHAKVPTLIQTAWLKENVFTDHFILDLCILMIVCSEMKMYVYKAKVPKDNCVLETFLLHFSIVLF